MFAVVNYTFPGNDFADVRVVSITPEQVEDYSWTNSSTDYCPIGVYDNAICAEKAAKAERRRINRRINRNGGCY